MGNVYFLTCHDPKKYLELGKSSGPGRGWSVPARTIERFMEECHGGSTAFTLDGDYCDRMKHEVDPAYVEFKAIPEDFGGGWIGVKDRLPEGRTWVLGVTHFGSQVIAASNSDTGDFWSDQQGYTIHVTHWRPLPDSPPST